MSYKRTVLITGGTINLGYHAALNIAKQQPDYLVVLSSRTDKEHAADTINKTLGQKNTIFVPLDLSSLAKVRDFAQKWSSSNYPPIQSLVLNAGLQFPFELTKTGDGLESTFGINHVGHSLLFHLLVPYLTDSARVVVTSSGTHDPEQKTGMPDAKFTTAEDLAHPPPDMVKIDGRQRYSSSKLANILWTYALDRRFSQQRPKRNITVNAFDPGLMPGTGLAREYGGFLRFVWLHILPRLLPLMRLVVSPNVHSPVESGLALARLAVGADVEGETGKYFEGQVIIPSSKVSHDKEKQDDLWRWTVDYVAQSEEERNKFDELK